MEKFPEEDGFPCAHRKPRQYLLHPDTTEEVQVNPPGWKEVWQHYVAAMQHGGHRFLSWTRWRQYVQRLFPGVYKNRTVEDECDSCTRIKIELLRTDLPPAERASLKLELEMHLGAARAQRKAMNDMIRLYAHKEGVDITNMAGLPETP